MNKNTIIALLAGLLIGQSAGLLSARAQQPAGITKEDLIQAAALAGMLANEHSDPFGMWGIARRFRSKKDFVDEAKSYSKEF